ncbi:VOC family protein [Saccharothrix coeruleofusca]|nr:VOC family protein [Saccharothrix coeruleofusca]
MARSSASTTWAARAGGAVIRQYDMGGKPDRVLMADPEGNEFCVI